MKRILTCVFSVLIALTTQAIAYTNPVLPYDYSDPDICRVGDDYYMTSSSFNCVPGLQILHSKDLLHWTIIGAAISDVIPGTEGLTAPQYGNCVWAPSIRYHDNHFYIFYGDPDRGIYMIKGQFSQNTLLERRSDHCQDIEWDKAILVKPGLGLIDPCPLWDEDGRVYLVHAYARSRAGIKSYLAICELSKDATSCITESKIVFDGHEHHPTCEGPKFYKHNGLYYIFTPAGGVATGWQTVLRSNNVYGPYEDKIVLEQGDTEINGPHQGAWVTTPEGKDWFMHFQDVGIQGRILHLQPMRWEDGWPVMGESDNPLTTVRENGTKDDDTLYTPSIYVFDDFDSDKLDLQWQWAANINSEWYCCNAEKSQLRLYTFPAEDLSTAPNLLLQKVPYADFTATAKVRFHTSGCKGDKCGLIVMGNQHAELCMENMGNRVMLNGDKKLKANAFYYLRVHMTREGVCTFSYSKDGKHFKQIGDTFQATEGKWIGCKVGLFCTMPNGEIQQNRGWMDVDSFEIK